DSDGLCTLLPADTGSPDWGTQRPAPAESDRLLAQPDSCISGTYRNLSGGGPEAISLWRIPYQLSPRAFGGARGRPECRRRQARGEPRVQKRKRGAVRAEGRRRGLGRSGEPVPHAGAWGSQEPGGELRG
ncbi:unnamed protein product, partial [Gulo gulo]